MNVWHGQSDMPRVTTVLVPWLSQSPAPRRSRGEDVRLKMPKCSAMTVQQELHPNNTLKITIDPSSHMQQTKIYRKSLWFTDKIQTKSCYAGFRFVKSARAPVDRLRLTLI